MRIRLIFLSLLFVTSSALAQLRWPDPAWSRIDPAAAGWSTEKLEAAKAFYESTSTDAVMIVHRGAVVAAWGEIDEPYNVRSIRKALLNALLEDEFTGGRLKTTQTLAQLGIDDRDGLAPREKQATLHDVLTSSSGITHPAAYEASGDRPPRGSIARGTFWYNNWDFNLAGALYERSSRRKIGEAFATTIAAPLQMADFRREHVTYRTEDQSRYPAALFEMSARDLARFGLLYSRGGSWRGRQILDRRWIEASTRPHVRTPRKGQSFGYLWWVRDDGAFVSTGNGGQQLYVDPKRDLVVVQLAASDKLLLRKLLGTTVSNAERAELFARILAAAPAR